jgi:hypothetical protein
MKRTATQAQTAKKSDSTPPKIKLDPPKIIVEKTKGDPSTIAGGTRKGTTQGDPPKIVPGG